MTEETPTKTHPFNTSLEHAATAARNIAERDALSFEDALQLSEAGLNVPGYGIFEIIQKHLGLAELQGAVYRVKRDMISARVFLDALTGFSSPEPSEVRTAEHLAALGERVAAFRALLDAAIVTANVPPREPVQIERAEDGEDGEGE